MSSLSGRRQDVSAVARSSAVTLVGSVVSAGMGLLFVVAIGRLLGSAGAGIVFQGVAAFTIATGIAKMGLDTTAVWLLPRLRDEQASDVRRAVPGLLLPTLAIGTLVGLGLVVLVSTWSGQDSLVRAVRAMAWAMPAATFTMVALAATRALGGVRTYVLLGNVTIPSLRPPLAFLVVALGGTAASVALSWTVPFYLAAIVVALVLLRQLSRTLGPAPRRWSVWSPTARLTRRTWTFALPRAVATALQQTMTWLDVILVGVLADAAAAGIYGAATRFVGAGMVLSTSLRIVVAPLYSRQLGAGHLDDAQHLYTVTTRWIVLFSAPVYVALALYGGTVLQLLGSNFREGAVALAVLAVGMTVVLTAGNVQSVLLMSGHSAVTAINKAVAVTVNIGLLVLLIPSMGITGAAVAWSAAMIIDTGLAVWQVKYRVGLTPAPSDLWFALAIVFTGVAAPCLVSRFFLGDSAAGLVVGVGASMVVHGLLLWLLRDRCGLNELAAIVRRRTKGN